MCRIIFMSAEVSAGQCDWETSQWNSWRERSYCRLQQWVLPGVKDYSYKTVGKRSYTCTGCCSWVIATWHERLANETVGERKARLWFMLHTHSVIQCTCVCYSPIWNRQYDYKPARRDYKRLAVLKKRAHGGCDTLAMVSFFTSWQTARVCTSGTECPASLSPTLIACSTYWTTYMPR